MTRIAVMVNTTLEGEQVSRALILQFEILYDYHSENENSIMVEVEGAVAHSSADHHGDGMTGKRLSFCWSMIITTTPSSFQ